MIIVQVSQERSRVPQRISPVLAIAIRLHEIALPPRFASACNPSQNLPDAGEPNGF
ncbi:MAG: hypothetical protein KME12_17165 [Trichocoleus desertorum ATA4-8-CV12]|nr:hypothetical protein [Trichocoleus desertorum ATA4-8-CV12]